ncbi:uncharacterized protein LOC124133832 isoform X2 [Haliotis rufescens]|uniref:uncharacterized protein LOC124133832 isoform X2 n=1 Tax=Haliotis rufescens TaxID=6454 RepID=UPI001EAFE9AA|nr:uncharacterized protein LOC124133832 isoform X2 [Haliotis rufescens]
MLSFLLSAIIVTSTLAATPCCTDRQFEARFGEVGGGIFPSNGQAAPALLNKKMTILTKYACYLMEDTAPFIETCIPDDAVKIRESYIGFGVKAIPFTTWQFLAPGTDNVVRLSVTDHGCIPIFESFFGTLQGGFADILYVITNFQPGIRNMSVFNVPSNCISIPPNDAPDVVRRSIDKAESLMKHFRMQL